MTHVTALPLLTASHSHLQYPSPVLPPGTVLPWHLPAHSQVCSVHTTGTPAGSASCSPGLRSWRSSGDLLGPGDAQTCRRESGIAHITQDQKQQYCSRVSTGPRSRLKSSLPPGNGTEAPPAAWCQHNEEGSSQHWTGWDRHQTPPTSMSPPLGGNFSLNWRRLQEKAFPLPQSIARSCQGSNGTWYPSPHATAPWHQIPHGNGHMTPARAPYELWDPGNPTPPCTWVCYPALGPPWAEQAKLGPCQTHHPGALQWILLNHFVWDLQGGKWEWDFMNNTRLLHLLRACKREVTNRMSIQFVTIRKNVLHEICIKELGFRNAKMNIYAILISRVPWSNKILELQETNK